MSTLRTFALSCFFASSLVGAACNKPSGAGLVDAAAEAPAQLVTLPGVDVSALTKREHAEWSQHVTTLKAPCPGVSATLAKCVTDKLACNVCEDATKMVLSLVRQGAPVSAVNTFYKNRFDMSAVQKIDEEGSPSEGAASAPITLVEFADFTCPHCAKVAPAIAALYDTNKNSVRVIYKFFVLGGMGHEHGDAAARAGIAAFRQGKFWEMNRTMFAHQSELMPSKLEGYAKDLGLKLEQYKADADAKDASERIAKDRALAERLGVTGTPSLYINGRKYSQGADLEEWINMELKMLGQAPLNVVTAPTVDAGVPSDSGASKASSASAASKPTASGASAHK